MLGCGPLKGSNKPWPARYLREHRGEHEHRPGPVATWLGQRHGTSSPRRASRRGGDSAKKDGCPDPSAPARQPELQTSATEAELASGSDAAAPSTGIASTDRSDTEIRALQQPQEAVHLRATHARRAIAAANHARAVMSRLRQQRRAASGTGPPQSSAPSWSIDRPSRSAAWGRQQRRGAPGERPPSILEARENSTRSSCLEVLQLWISRSGAPRRGASVVEGTAPAV